MARPRKPTAELELKGAFKKDPQRKRPNEPKVSLPFGDPPEHLPPDVRACWFELSSMAAANVLTFADMWAAEVAAQHMAEFRRNPENFPASKMARLVTLMGKMGLTPADRASMSIAQPNKEENPFAEFH
jgi:phage terminase small subunit